MFIVSEQKPWGPQGGPKGAKGIPRDPKVTPRGAKGIPQSANKEPREPKVAPKEATGTPRTPMRSQRDKRYNKKKLPINRRAAVMLNLSSWVHNF